MRYRRLSPKSSCKSIGINTRRQWGTPSSGALCHSCYFFTDISSPSSTSTWFSLTWSPTHRRRPTHKIDTSSILWQYNYKTQPRRRQWPRHDDNIDCIIYDDTTTSTRHHLSDDPFRNHTVLAKNVVCAMSFLRTSQNWWTHCWWHYFVMGLTLPICFWAFLLLLDWKAKYCVHYCSTCWTATPTSFGASIWWSRHCQENHKICWIKVSIKKQMPGKTHVNLLRTGKWPVIGYSILASTITIIWDTEGDIYRLMIDYPPNSSIYDLYQLHRKGAKPPA